MMFKSELELIASTRPDMWYVGAPLIWGFAGLTITVPVGFTTDLASIPKALGWLPDLDINGRARRPGVLHDWLYAGYRINGRAFADSTLYYACIAEGMDERGATAIYQGVALFGRAAWDDDGARRMSSYFRSNDDYVAWLRTGPVLNPA